MLTRTGLHVAALLGAILLIVGCERAEADTASRTVTLYVAASTAHVVEPLVAAWAAERGTKVTVNAGASSTLARQIEEGAPADIYLSANTKWMDHVEATGLLREGSRLDLLGNRLSLIAPASASPPVGETPEAVLAGPFAWLALGDPDHAPAGIYARQALTSLGLWDAVAQRVLPAKDVRSALVMVERGESDLGIVYATDAALSTRVQAVLQLPEPLHPPIRYPIALTAGASDEAAALLAWLTGPAAREAFESAGFVWLAGAESASLPGSAKRGGV